MLFKIPVAEHFKATGRQTKRTREKTATKTSFISSNNNLKGDVFSHFSRSKMCRNSCVPVSEICLTANGTLHAAGFHRCREIKRVFELDHLDVIGRKGGERRGSGPNERPEINVKQTERGRLSL